MKKLACAVMALFCASCASTSDVELLQQRLRQSEQRQKQQEEELRRSQAALQEEINRQGSPVRASQANMWAEIEKLKVQSATLQGQMDAVQRDSGDRGAVNQRLDALQVEVQAIRQSLRQIGVEVAAPAAPGGPAEGQPPVAQTPGAPVPAQPPVAPAAAAGAPAAQAQPAAPQPPADPAQALYDRGIDAFKNNKFGDASSVFEDFIKSFPKHPNISSAVFWKGESYFEQKNYAQAVLDYQEVLDKYPKSPKAPSAMLKQGIAFTKLNKNKPGKLRLQEVVQKYPNSPEAKRAQILLKDIKD